MLCLDLLEVALGIGCGQVVEVFILLGFLEGEDAVDEDEENDTQGEDISLTSIIYFSLLNFRSHICEGATVRPEHVYLAVGSEAEVSYLQVHFFVEKDVLDFEVAVHDIFLVHVRYTLD